MNNEFEKHGFYKKNKNDKKIVIHLINIQNNINKTYDFNFETNLIYDIPETNAKFAVACLNDNDIRFFVNNIIYGVEGDSPANRAVYPGLTEKYQFCNYVYYPNEALKLHLQGNYYIEILVLNKD